MNTKFSIYFLVTLMIFGCYKNVRDIYISNEEIVIGNNPTKIQCRQKINRINEYATLRIEIEEDWKPFPPWEEISVEGKGNVRIEVFLNASNGQTFKSKILGNAGGMVDVRFDHQPPKKLNIDSVTITGSKPLRIKKIIWHDFNPI